MVIDEDDCLPLQQQLQQLHSHTTAVATVKVYNNLTLQLCSLQCSAGTVHFELVSYHASGVWFKVHLCNNIQHVRECAIEVWTGRAAKQSIEIMEMAATLS